MIPKDLRTLDRLFNRIALTAAIAATAGFILFYLAVVRPAHQRLEAMRNQAAVLQTQLALRHEAAAAGAAGVQDVQALRERLRKSPRLSEPHEPDAFLREVSSLCEQNGLRRLTWEAGQAKRSNMLSEFPLTLRFQGDFLDVCAFLRQTEAMPWLTRIKGLYLNANADNAGQVDVRVSLKAYSSEEQP